jgi:hypothetical protein
MSPRILPIIPIVPEDDPTGGGGVLVGCADMPDSWSARPAATATLAMVTW